MIQEDIELQAIADMFPGWSPYHRHSVGVMSCGFLPVFEYAGRHPIIAERIQARWDARKLERAICKPAATPRGRL